MPNPQKTSSQQLNEILNRLEKAEGQAYELWSDLEVLTRVATNLNLKSVLSISSELCSLLHDISPELNEVLQGIKEPEDSG